MPVEFTSCSILFIGNKYCPYVVPCNRYPISVGISSNSVIKDIFKKACPCLVLCSVLVVKVFQYLGLAKLPGICSRSV